MKPVTVETVASSIALFLFGAFFIGLALTPLAFIYWLIR